MLFSKEPYASHQPILYAYANRIKNGHIIEYGAGDFSTPMLHDICQKNNNTLVTVENDSAWLSKFIVTCPGFHWHSYISVKDYTDLLDINHKFKADLVFIDGYTWGSRLFCLRESLRAESDIVIVHDCDFLVNGSHKKDVPVDAIVFDKLWPPTMVAGDKIEINWEEGL